MLLALVHVILLLLLHAGPLPQTLADFWRLIWQEDICCVLMMLSVTSDGGIVRCQQYWPDAIGVAAFYGPFKIIVERINDNEISEERIIKLSVSSIIMM